MNRLEMFLHCLIKPWQEKDKRLLRPRKEMEEVITVSDGVEVMHRWGIWDGEVKPLVDLKLNDRQAESERRWGGGSEGEEARLCEEKMTVSSIFHCKKNWNTRRERGVWRGENMHMWTIMAVWTTHSWDMLHSFYFKAHLSAQLYIWTSSKHENSFIHPSFGPPDEPSCPSDSISLSVPSCRYQAGHILVFLRFFLGWKQLPDAAVNNTQLSSDGST